MSFFRPGHANRPPSRDRADHRRGVSHSHLPSAALVPPSDLQRSYSSSLSQSMGLRGMRRLEQRRGMEESHFLHSRARSLNLDEKVDLRLVDYVAPLDDNLTCPICRCPFVDPVILAECDHCFCRDCIRQTWVTASSVYNPHGPRGDCPTCRTPAKLGPRSSTSKILLNILDDLLVKCPKTSEGCPVQIKRGEVQTHVSIYCGFAMVECPVETCRLPIHRKDSNQGCRHHGVSCLACHEELMVSDLERHWNTSCPDRTIICEQCSTPICYQNLVEHNQRICPAVCLPCPGHAYGCANRSKKEQADIHAKSCTFAKLAPILDAQKQRMDEQEAAQRQMSRKLEVLETSFSSMQEIVFPRTRSLEAMVMSTSESVGPDQNRRGSNNSDGSTLSVSQFPPFSDSSFTSPDMARATSPFSQPQLAASSSHEMDANLAFPSSSLAGGPFASPFHHLLSMHENLREELNRTASALAELDGRHSMQILNENIRVRDEITYFGAQVAGLQRQVAWLTSERLQRAQQQHQALTGGGAVGEVPGSSMGDSVERAVNAVNSAVMGAARMVNASTGTSGTDGAGPSGTRMRRGNSDEGRPTKL